MNSSLIWIAVVVLLGGGGAIYYYRNMTPEPPPKVAEAPPAPAPAPAAPEPPSIQHPVPDAEAGAPPLPPLASSDTLAQDTLVRLFGKEAYARVFIPDSLVRHFVVTVDNLPRKAAAQRLSPLRPVPGTFAVTTKDGTLAIGEQNAFRYRPYVLVLEAVEAKKLVAAYVRLYPLFQAAYQELGYPDGYFNDRLVVAIDDLLAAPESAAPALVQPKVLYQFADASMEDRSAGQKAMIRIGPANEARVKEKLRAIRKELTGRMAPPQ